MEPPNSPDQFDLVKKALLAGRKIEAIKLYREQTGAGLAEAKAAVEALESGTREMSAASALSSRDYAEAIRAALLAGRKIEAIRLYREQHKVGLAEAKAAVDALEHGTREMPATSASSSPDHAEAICAALLAGKKIEAIQLYRVQYKVGLAKAKAAVDAMEVQIRGLPGNSSPVQSRGCFGMVAIGVLITVAVWKALA